RWNVALAISSTDELQAVYFDHGNNQLRYAHRAIGGTWATSMIAAASSLGPGASLAVGPQDDLHVSFIGVPSVEYGHLVPGGSWEIATVDPHEGAETTIAVDASNVAYVAFETFTDPGIDVASSPPNGTWSPMPIDGVSGAARQPTIAVATD